MIFIVSGMEWWGKYDLGECVCKEGWVTHTHILEGCHIYLYIRVCNSVTYTVILQGAISRHIVGPGPESQLPHLTGTMPHYTCILPHSTSIMSHSTRIMPHSTSIMPHLQV